MGRKQIGIDPEDEDILELCLDTRLIQCMFKLVVLG
jgi:hypothetical protein